MLNVIQDVVVNVNLLFFYPKLWCFVLVQVWIKRFTREYYNGSLEG